MTKLGWTLFSGWVCLGISWVAVAGWWAAMWRNRVAIRHWQQAFDTLAAQYQATEPDEPSPTDAPSEIRQ